MVRRSNKDWIVGTYSDKSLTDMSKLPTNREVLSRYLFYRNEFKSETTRELFKVITSELEYLWGKAGIPIKENREIVDQLMRLFQQWYSLNKIKVSLRSKNNTRLDSFKRQLETLCDLSAIDAYRQMRSSRRKNWREDWAFYEDQRGPRKGYMTNVDQEFVRKEQQIISKRLRQENRIEKSRQPVETQVPVTLETDNEMSDKENQDDDFQLFNSAKKRKLRSSTIELAVSPATLIKDSVQVADRCGLSINSQLLLTSQIVTSSGGNLADFSLSRTSVWRSRLAIRKQISEKIKTEWLRTNPKHLIVHWDTKIFNSSLNKNKERIAVILSGCSSG
jgi:hypothetical protein